MLRLNGKKWLFFVVGITLASTAYADIFNKLKEQYIHFEGQVKEQFEEKNDKQSVDPSNQVGSLESEKERQDINYPSEWIQEIVEEPIFGSQLYVFNAGLNHKQTVLLIHGLGQKGHKDWLNVIPELSKNYHVLALDLPGFGYSSIPEGKFSPTNYSKLLEWLVGKYAKGPLDVVGHSMGGAVALRFASSYPKRVGKLVLVDVAGILERTAFLKHTAKLPVSKSNKEGKLARLSAQVEDFGSGLIEMLSRAPDPTPYLNNNDIAWNKAFSGHPNVNAAMALIEEDFSKAINSLAISTHIIWGKMDRVAPLRTGILLEHRLPDARLLVLDEAGHVPMNSHPSEFIQLLADALEENSGDNRETEAFAEKVNDGSVVDAGVLTCKKQSGQIYSGSYQSVIVEDCVDITLKNLITNKIVLKDSVVTMQNVTVNAEKEGITAVESSVSATACDISGHVGIYAKGSRLDLAGVSIKANKYAVKVKNRSRFVVSVSDMSSPLYTGSVHGVYHVKKTTLDAKLAKR